MKLSHVVMSLLSDIECDLRMRPIDMAWNAEIFAAVVIPNEATIEFLDKGNYKVCVDHWSTDTVNTKWPTNSYQNHNFSLADPNSLQKLTEFLEETIYQKSIIVEFPAKENLDYLMAK